MNIFANEMYNSETPKRVHEIYSDDDKTVTG